MVRDQDRPRRPATPRSDAPRVDARDKVTGAATYVEDLPEPAGTAYAAALRSPYSHARILAIDSAAAERVPGVLAVLHRDNLHEYPVHLDRVGKGAVFDAPTDNHFIATDKARFDGDLLGMVVATDLRTARWAADAIEFDYEILAPAFSFDEAMAVDAPLVHEQTGTNLALSQSLEWGDVDSAVAGSDHVFRAAFTSPTIYHHPIEPAMSALVRATEAAIDYWVPSNNPFDVVDIASKLFGMDREQVRVRVPYIGGNFGSKHMTPELLVAAALSRRVGRPVKFIASEEESFRVTARHAMTYRATLGLRADGTITGLDVELDIDTGAYFTGARIATGNAVNASWGGYRVPNCRVRARTAYTNKVPAAMFRNTGKNQTAFALDCLMDHAARSIGMEPVAFRVRNLMQRGERLPVERWKRNGIEGPAQSPPLDTDFADLISRAMRAIGWESEASGSPGSDTGGALEAGSAKPDRNPRGRGIAVSLRRGSSIGTATAMATLEADGTVLIAHNAPDVGEGAHTVIRVVAATALGLPQDHIRVGEPDTANQLPFSGTSSQRTTVQMGTAVANACERLKQEILHAAAATHGGHADDWSFQDGRVVRSGQASVSLAELARTVPADGAIRGVGVYDRGAVEDVSFGSHDHWSPGVAAAEVEVDRATGDVRVLQYAAVADAGRVMHYHSARGQIEGGAVMGFGAALSEEVVYGEGQLLNADAFQYRLPLLSDIPEAFETFLVENGDGPGPFGAKGIAQTSIPCAAPAIANAICDALGVRLYSTPFTPEKILRALGDLQSG